MKQLSGCAIAELEIEAKFAGKLWAYVPRMAEYDCGLGIAIANEPGYCPIPQFWASGSYVEMDAEADRLNLARGQSVEESLRIVVSSIAAGKVA